MHPRPSSLAEKSVQTAVVIFAGAEKGHHTTNSYKSYTSGNPDIHYDGTINRPWSLPTPSAAFIKCPARQ
jgi:hypothetical protein